MQNKGRSFDKNINCITKTTKITKIFLVIYFYLHLFSTLHNYNKTKQKIESKLHLIKE